MRDLVFALDNEPSACGIKELTGEQLNEVGGGRFNAYVSFGDIKGESSEKNHKDWVAAIRF